MKKCYNEGGMPEYERESDEQDRKEKEAVMAKPLAKASFKEAFAEARANGEKTFEYMGKKYTTELAKPKAPAKRRPLPGKAAEGRMSDVVGAKKGGMVSSASKRGDGCAVKGKTRGRMV